MNYNFLVLQAQKILNELKPMYRVFHREFMSSLISDLIKLAKLIITPKTSLKDEEIFFMTLTIFILYQGVDVHEKEMMCEILNNFSGTEDVKKVNKMWSKIKAFFPKNVDIESLTLPSFDDLKEHDKDNGTSYYDLVRTNYSKFVQCLIKADGKISREEKEMEKKINKILYPKGKPSQKNEDGISIFELFEGMEGIRIKNSGTGVKITFSGIGKETEENIIGEVEENEKETESIVNDEEASEENLDTVIEEINSLIGLENIKKEINTLINLIKIKKVRKERGMPETDISLHSVFYGPPGTGKTTIARLLGRVFKCLGLLDKGHVVETDRAGLVAGFVGQTAIQTDKMIKQAMDGILFVDEAYALKGNDNDFGHEAIDTILKRMEDNRERLVVVVAGYPKEMEAFISSNPGLKSRFSRYFYFKDYSPEELVEIFKLFCTKAYLTLAKPAETKLLALLQKYYENKDKSFGNGRLARNIFEKVIENQANRLVDIAPLTDEALSTICKEDIPVQP